MMPLALPRISWLREVDVFFLALVVVGVVYVSLTLTPSSYGVALQLLGVEGHGPLFGTAHPIRSDEWAVLTPTLQSLVNNGFARFNATSVFAEDFRSFNAFPIFDAGMVFKPYYWPFLVVSPALAYSFSSYAFIFLFLVGYQRLFKRMGLRGVAAALSTLMFFTGYAQYVWTTVAQGLALFPWVMLTILWRPNGRKGTLVKGAAVAYVSACWLLALFYPPLLVTLAFAGTALILVARPDIMRSPGELAAIAAGVAIGIAVSLWYLRDLITPVLESHYPGQRVVTGGGVPFRIWLSMFVPYLNIVEHEAIYQFGAFYGDNICAMGVIGSYLPLALLIFASHGALWQRFAGADGGALRWRVAVLLLAFALTSAWMLLPVPPSLGRVLLWDKVPPTRMIFANGLILMLLLALILRETRWVVTPLRIGVFAAVVVVTWAVSKLGLAGTPLAATWFDGVVLVPLSAALIPAVRARVSAGGLVLGAVLIGNLVPFGSFNPLQSAGPIFERPDSPVIAAMRTEAAQHPAGWVVRGFPGSVLNGWGLASVSHVAVLPQLGFFRLFFPELSPKDFDAIFNRYHHIQLVSEGEPTVPQVDVVTVPVGRFLGEPPARTVRLNPPVLVPERRHGDLAVTVRDGAYVLSGWAPWRGLDVRQSLEIFTAEPVAVEAVHTVARPDVARAFVRDAMTLAGFEVVLRPLQGTAGAETAAFCVIATDPALGRFLLNNPKRPAGCEGYSKP